MAGLLQEAHLFVTMLVPNIKMCQVKSLPSVQSLL
ncbi:MAG: Uncharacterised protein [Gammaproteobacteria bacterium]|nr:MAG: Uncharacterised protein [Gammaproteobacteria bacterium]